MAKEQLKTLTEPMYYILLALTKRQHGYGIMQHITELTDGRVVVGPGTLYTLLGRFEKEEIITQIGEEGRRKIYCLTEKGGDILTEEYKRLRLMVADGAGKFNGENLIKDDPFAGEGVLEALPDMEIGELKLSEKAEEKESTAAGRPGNTEKPSKDKKVKEKDGEKVRLPGKLGGLLPT